MLKFQNRVEFNPIEAQPTGNFSVAKNQLANDCVPEEQPANNNTAQEPTKYLWIRAPKTLVYNTTFTDGAKLLYLILLDYQGRNSYAYPSLDTLARDTGKSTRRVQQILKELEAGGAIEIVSQPGWVNLYRVNLPPASSDLTATASTSSNNATIQEGDVVSTAFISDRAKSLVKNSAPQKDSASLPMKPLSTELDSVELDKNTVCKTLPVSLVYEDKQVHQNGSNAQLQTPCYKQPNPQLNSYVKLQPEITLTDEQTEIAQMLRVAGLATVNAERIALTNPAKSAVQEWIEFSKSKANPGGYLAVVLSKADAAPPPSSSKCVNASVLTAKLTTGNSQGRYQPRKNDWHANNRKQQNNQEAGALAFIRRHQNELEKWQNDQDEYLRSSAGSSQCLADQPASYVNLETINNFNCEPASIGTTGQAGELSSMGPESNAEHESVAMLGSKTGELSVDPHLRSLIRQVDREACQYLKQARIEAGKLIVSFIGNYRPQQSLESWLPMLRLSNEAVSGVLLI